MESYERIILSVTILDLKLNWYVSSLLQGTGKQDKKDGVHERVLSATFADLPGPQLKWEKMAPAPVPRLDGAAIQIKDLLYVFAGYGTINDVRILTLPLMFWLVYSLPKLCLTIFDGLPILHDCFYQFSCVITFTKLIII